MVAFYFQASFCMAAWDFKIPVDSCFYFFKVPFVWLLGTLRSLLMAAFAVRLPFCGCFCFSGPFDGCFYF